MNEIKTILDSTLTKVQTEMITTFDTAGLSSSSNQKELMEKVIKNAVDPFKEIGTRYLQDKYIQENLHICTTANYSLTRIMEGATIKQVL